MTRLFLGVDVGATKSHALIADEDGRALGFGEGGSGNHQAIGFTAMSEVFHAITDQALTSAGVRADQIAGAGFGIGGCDWPCDREPIARVIDTLGLGGPYEFSNDATVGLLAGAPEGWGVGVVAGTGCNCWGRDRDGREGHVTGEDYTLAEHCGSSGLVRRALQAIALAWTRRGPETRLADVFLKRFGAHDVENLLEGFMRGRYPILAADAPLVFRTAADGDLVAEEMIRWAGRELGSLAIGVIRQLHFEPMAFDVVSAGSFFNGSPVVNAQMAETIRVVAPGARFVALTAPPVVGGVVMGMQAVGLRDPQVRERLIESCGAMLAARRV